MKRLFLIMLLLSAQAQAQTITASQGTGSSAVTTVAMTYSAPLTNPSVLIVCACGRTSMTVADTGLRTWNEGKTLIYATNRESHCWYSNNSSTTAPTVTVTSLANFNQVEGIEVTGLLASGSLDQTGSASNASATNITVTTGGSVAQSGELVIAAGCIYDASRTWSVDAASSVVLQTGLNGFSSSLNRLTAITGLSGTQSIVETISGAAASIGGVIVTFKAAASGIVGPKHKIVDH